MTATADKPANASPKIRRINVLRMKDPEMHPTFTEKMPAVLEAHKNPVLTRPIPAESSASNGKHVQNTIVINPSGVTFSATPPTFVKKSHR